ncbi:sugar ABC transporter substrate-binding protein [Adlercreutzia sp. R21]|uniref:ABC transporter substrate-binding protein n=1 Tax=Adlercreutzia wanghongyangiae TaxID=3111451 RepID=UPI002DBD0059|nr:sugar ABC transporter substrate-binding protein [Adlercreutzia sp. R21]MEC4184002.1 sugar ABC transporter substrate-binding protein [Adlercreutzia sp. R21]
MEQKTAKRRRIQRVGIALAAAALVLGMTGAVACASAEPEASGGNGALSGELVFWHSFVQADRAAAIEEAAARFEEENPGTSITIETMPWTDFKKRWRAGAASGDLPDISTACNMYEAEELVAAGLLQPADAVIDAIGRERFADNVLAELTHAGDTYGVPYYSHAYVLWYRTDLLAAAGLSVPRTWDELATAARTLTDPEQGIYGCAMALSPDDFTAVINLHMYVRAAGGSLLDDNLQANFTSPEALAGIAYWAELYRDCSPADAIDDSVTEQAARFYAGQTAFDFNSGFHVSGVAGTSPELLDDISCAPLPAMDADGAAPSSVVTHIPLVLYRQTQNPALAQAFLEFLYEDENYGTFLDSAPVGMLPSIRGISSTEDYQSNPLRRQFADEERVIQNAMLTGNALGFEEGPNLHAGILVSSDAIEVMFRRILQEKTPVEEAAREAEDQLNRQFAEADATLAANGSANQGNSR